MDHFIITERCSTLRRLAREALRGRWKMALCAVLLYFAAISVPSYILNALSPTISSVYSLLVTGPFVLGCSIFILSLVRNDSPRIWQVFYGFERFGKSLGLYLLICLFVTLWSLIMVPGFIVASFVPFLLPFAVLLFVPAVLALLRYSQAFFVLADRTGTGVFECIAKSKFMMAGNKWKYFKLQLSFIGWAILASLPYTAVVSYIAAKVMQSVNYSLLYGQEQILQYYNQILTGLTSVGGSVAMLISSLPMIPFMVYLFSADAAFFDIAAGNLKPGYIAATAEIIDEVRPEAEDS